MDVQGRLQPLLRAAQHDAEVWLGKGPCWHTAVQHACGLHDVADRPSCQASNKCSDRTTHDAQAIHPIECACRPVSNLKSVQQRSLLQDLRSMTTGAGSGDSDRSIASADVVLAIPSELSRCALQAQKHQQ